jgi:hypothetical protein
VHRTMRRCRRLLTRLRGRTRCVIVPHGRARVRPAAVPRRERGERRGLEDQPRSHVEPEPAAEKSHRSAKKGTVPFFEVHQAKRGLSPFLAPVPPAYWSPATSATRYVVRCRSAAPGSRPGARSRA